MPTKYCFLCASDEGVFLDITTGNKQTFYTQFKICSLVKPPTADQLPTKICHKCAYELNQCSTFLQKYKKAAKQKNYNRKKCCGLCFEQTKSEYIFDLKKENTLQLKSINKIQQILNDDIDTDQGNRILVCLSCRYTVDVLSDLKKLSNIIASKLHNNLEEDIDYSHFPKVQTTVISRKTTIPESARVTLKPKQNTDADSDAMIRTRSKFNAKDIEAQSPAETKVCKVFLKDVLSQRATQKGKKVNEIAKKATTTKQLKSLSNDVESDVRKQAEKRPLRSANINDSDQKDAPNKKVKCSAKEMVSERELSPPTEPVRPRSTRNRKASANDRHVAQDSDSDSALSSSNVKELKGPLTKHKKITGSSFSDADVEIKRGRKRLKSILTANSSAKGSDINDESANDEDASKKKQLRFRSDSPIYIDLTTTSDGNERPRRNAAKRRAFKKEKVEKPAVVKTASAKKPQLNSELEAKTHSIIEEEIKTYSCEECGVNYENKLVFLTHKLTHCKQPRLELEKVTVESKPNAVSRDTSEAADEQSEDQLEIINITVDDDEEEAELESNNLDSSVDTNLSTSSRVEEVAASPEKETPEDTVDTEVSSKVLDSGQPTETDDKDRKSLQSRRSISLSGSTGKDNVENASELVEEENVENISLTNIEDNQEEEKEAKEVGRESEREEKTQDEEVADSEDAIVDVEEDKEAEKQDREKPKETTSKEKLGDDVDIDKLDSSQKIEAERAQGEAKLDSSDGPRETNDTALVEKLEENQIEEEEKRNSSDALEENLKDKEKSELSDQSEVNLVADNLNSPAKSDEVWPNDKDKTDSSGRSEERRVTRTNRSVSFATLEVKGKQDSPENSREKSSSPGKSEERKPPRRGRSSPIARLEEDKRESSETPEETDKLGSPARSEERKSIRMTRSTLLGKIEEDKQESSEKSERKDKLGSPVRSEERKSTRKARFGFLGKSEEDKQDSSEKSGENDKFGSPVRSAERKCTRKSKTGITGKIEEDKEESAEKPEEEDKMGSPARSVERKSTGKSKSGLAGKIEEDKEESAEKPEEEDKMGSPARSVERKSTRKSKSGKIEEDKEESAEKPEQEDILGSPTRSVERKSTRKGKSGKIEEDKEESAEKPEQEDILGSPARSVERKSTRKGKSGKIEEDNEESAEKPEEEDNLGSPARSVERKNTRKSKAGKIVEDKEESTEKPEEEDKLGSPVRSAERKSTRKSKSGKIEEDKEESAEKPEEGDRRGSSSESEEKMVTRTSKSNLLGKSEEKDKQDSSEKPKDESISSEKLDEDESKEKRNDNGDAIVEANDDIVEVNDDASLDSIKEVRENDRTVIENDADHAEEVQAVVFNDGDTRDVEEVCEQKDGDLNDDEEVQCAETKCSEEKSSDKNGEDIVEVEIGTQPTPTSDSADAVSEILQLVLDLASTEIQKRQDSAEIVADNDSDDSETLENISREVQNGGDTRPRE